MNRLSFLLDIFTSQALKTSNGRSSSARTRWAFSSISTNQQPSYKWQKKKRLLNDFSSLFKIYFLFILSGFLFFFFFLSFFVFKYVKTKKTNNLPGELQPKLGATRRRTSATLFPICEINWKRTNTEQTIKQITCCFGSSTHQFALTGGWAAHQEHRFRLAIHKARRARHPTRAKLAFRAHAEQREQPNGWEAADTCPELSIGVPATRDSRTAARTSWSAARPTSPPAWAIASSARNQQQ